MEFLDFPVRIRYAETDQMGISYHANYLIWFEAARAELFRALELPYTEFEKSNMYLPVADAYCKYMAPSFYDQLIYIRVSVAQLKASTMKFTYHVLDDSRKKFLAWGYTRHVFVNAQRKMIPVPQVIRERVCLYTLQEKPLNS